MRRGAGAREGWVLVLDVGSSSARSRLYRQGGRVVDPGPASRAGYRWRVPEVGAMEYSAEELLEHVVGVIDAAVACARAEGLEIVAVATAAFWHSLVGIGSEGSALTPVYAWGDTRAAGAALRLQERIDEPEEHARTGCFLDASYPRVKLAWLRARDPELFASVDRWVSFAEFLELRLRGELRCSLSMASGTGLLDVCALRWDPAALESSGLTAGRLAPLADASEGGRGLASPWRTRWPELEGACWFPALGDGACANVGSGAIGRERLALTVGTTTALRVLWAPDPGEQVPPNLWCYRLDGRRWVVGGALSNGGGSIARLRHLLELPPPEAAEAALEAMPPDAHGLTVLPFLIGERGPGWAARQRAVVLGLSQRTTQMEILRAWMEAIALDARQILTRIQEVAGPIRRVEGSGGALRASPAWAAIFADVLGLPLVLAGDEEATAHGAAALALEALGVGPEPGGDDRPDLEEQVRFEPRRDFTRVYSRAAERTARFADALRPLQQDLYANDWIHPGSDPIHHT